MRCVTGKNGYYSEEEAEEALIRSQINFATAAVNYYLCHDCEEFHLTSQGEVHPLLKDPAIIRRIKEEQRSQEWERRFRR
jgi:hypothetical protein